MFKYLENITILLFTDSGFPESDAIRYVERNGTEELETEAERAYHTDFDDEQNEAEVLSIGDQEEADTIRDKYVLLDLYLEKAFEEMGDV